MPTYAFFPAKEEQRRSDQLNFAVAVGASANAARTVAETLLGEPHRPCLSADFRSEPGRKPCGRTSTAAAPISREPEDA